MAGFSLKQIILSLGLPIVVFASSAQPARSQIESSGRFQTSINGGSGTQSCLSGVCAISGGTDAGSNKFHRFTLFDANSSESSISGVTIETDDQSNIILGVASSSNGFNLSVPLSLDSSSNLFIVSPDGISLSTGASFSNVTDLTLTNLSTLPIGLGQFSVNSSLSEVQLLTGTPALSRTNPSLSTVASNAPITIGGVTLTVDGALYVHANSDLTVSNSTLNASSTLDVGGDLTVTGSTIDSNSQVALYSEGNLDLYGSTIDGNTTVTINSTSDFNVVNAYLDFNESLSIDVGGDLTVVGSTLDYNSLVTLYSEGNLDLYDSTIDGNTTVDIDAGNILTISESSSPSYTGVSISANTTVTINSTSDFNVVNAYLDFNDSLIIDVGGDFFANSHPSLFYGVSFDQNTLLSLTTLGDINIYDSSISDNGMIAIDSGGDFVFISSDLIGNLDYTLEQYVSDFDVVNALPYFTIDAIGMIYIEDSSIDFNGPFKLISSASDVFITDSDFLDNLYPYIESFEGDIFIASSELARNAFIDAYALGDAYIFDTSVVGNDLVIGAEQGDTVIISSDLSDNVLVATSTDGDSVIVDSNVDNNVLDVESESGDAVIVDSDVTDTDVVVVSTDGDSVITDSSVINTVVDVESETGDVAIADSDVIGSDVLAVSSDGDVVVFGSNVDESVFEAAALSGNVDVLNSEFTNNQELAFVADFDVSISDSTVTGNELVVIDVGNDALIESATMTENEGFTIESATDSTIASTSASDRGSVDVSAGSTIQNSGSQSQDAASDVSAGSTIQNSGSQSQDAASSDSSSSSQQLSLSASSSSSQSEGDSTNGTGSNSESASETSSDSESDTSSETANDEGGNDSSSSTAKNDDASDSQSGESRSGDGGESSAPSFQISTVDANVVASNLRDSIDSNAAEVLSALGLDDISPTPASELTPARIAQSLNDARQVYQALSFSSRNQSGPSVASDPSSNSSFIRSNLSDIAFNPAFLNVSFTKNSDLGVGDSNNGFIDLSLITSEGTVIGRRTELPLSELSSLLRGFYGKITSQRSLDPALQTSEASRLYALFIEPLQDVLTSEAISTVLISADRGLQAIPFSALAHQGQYAVENISFSFTPSLSLTDLSIPLENPEIDQILIMGSTEFSGLAPLPFVNQEVANIGQYYGAQSVLGEQFTSTRAVSDLRSSDQSLIHLATHADFKGGSPGESVIHTSDGSISFESFKSIRRERQSNPINLFVLSACRSALGDSDSEMGFAGMALQAGSKSAIGSLWYVDDVATSAFFSQFYRYLSRGVTKSTALTQTQRDFALGNIKIQGTDVVFGSDDVLLSGLSASQRYNYPSDFRHPFFWSGFVLLGTPW